MKNYIDELLNILNSASTDEEKKEQILQYHDNDIAELMDSLDDEKREYLYKILGNEAIASVIMYSDDIGDIVDDFKPEVAADIIELMDADDAIDVLEELDEEARNEIVSFIDEEVLDDIEAITQYDENQIGSKMTNNYITVLKDDTVKRAMREVIRQARDNDNLSNIFVLDENDAFYGVIELRDLIIARDKTDINEIIKTNYPAFNANEEIEDCISRLVDYSMDSYPILDNGRLVGVITSDDIIEAVDEEISDDYAKLAGLTEEEEIDESVFSSVKKRLPWLVVLLILGLVQSFCMSGFERVVAALPVIVFFQTLVLAMAGNTGTQSLAVTIRMLAEEENGKGLILKTIFKEIRIGMCNGLILAACAFLLVLGFLFITDQGVQEGGFEIYSCMKASDIVSIALFISMCVSSLLGTIVPILFMKIKIDPAVASGPFITTMNDVTALLIYYGLAAMLFASLL